MYSLCRCTVCFISHLPINAHACVTHLEFTAEAPVEGVSQVAAPPGNVEEMISFFGQNSNRWDIRYILLVCKGIFEYRVFKSLKFKGQMVTLLTGVIEKVRNQTLPDTFDTELCCKFLWPEMFPASSRSPTCDAVFYRINILYVSLNVFLLCECFFFLLFLH